MMPMYASEKSVLELSSIKYLANDIAKCVAEQREIASDNRAHYGVYGYEYNGVPVTLANNKTAIKRKIVLLRAMLLDLSKEIK